jgi:metallo-beta-lactamase class B
MAMEGDVPALESGSSFPVTKPDRIIHYGNTVSLGGVTLTAHLTPGHTKRRTTWTMTTQECWQNFGLVFVGSATVLPQYTLIDTPHAPATYAGIETGLREPSAC